MDRLQLYTYPVWQCTSVPCSPCGHCRCISLSLSSHLSRQCAAAWPAAAGLRLNGGLMLPRPQPATLGNNQGLRALLSHITFLILATFLSNLFRSDVYRSSYDNYSNVWLSRCPVLISPGTLMMMTTCPGQHQLLTSNCRGSSWWISSVSKMASCSSSPKLEVEISWRIY